MCFTRPSQVRPQAMGEGLLGEEQFDVALLLDQVKRIEKEGPQTRLQKLDLKLIQKFAPEFDIARCYVGVEAITDFQNFCLFQSNYEDQVDIKELWEAATTATGLQASHYLKTCRGGLDRVNQLSVKAIMNMSNPCKSRELRRLSSLMTIFLSRISAADFSFMCSIGPEEYTNFPKDKTPVLTFLGDEGPLKIVFGRKLVYMFYQGTQYLLSHDQWVMFHNKTVEMWLTLIYTKLSEGVQYTEGFTQRIINLIKKLHKLIEKYGNRAYQFHSLFEGLVTGYVINKEESWENSELLTTMWSAICDLRLGFYGEWDTSWLYDLFSQCSTPEMIELAGCIKLTGHPDIQTEEGLQKLHDRTHKYIPITPEHVIEVVNMIKQDFCQHYLQKHRRWPLVEIAAGAPEILIQSVLRNKWITDPELVRKYGQAVDLDMWNMVELQKIKEFDWVESHMPFLKDRALAPKLSQIVQEEGQRVNIPLEDRRVLLKFLLTSKVFKLTDKYLESYGDDPTSVIDYLVIKLTQKEKELKLGGRMFGQSPYEERFRRCIMEHNVARLMVDYDPYQSMTTDELQKLTKLLMFRSLRKDVKNGRVLQFSIDAEAWNNYFRPELVNTVGAFFFDQIFGTKLYRHTMDTYILSFIFANVSGEIKGWMGQPGGIEGLSQKVWTWIYARVALRVIESLGFKGYIMVCGDDLRIAIIFPEILFLDRTPAEVAADFKERLQAAFDRYGFKMKATETVASETFIAYGKVYQIGESFMPSVLKKISKIHGFQGTTFPLIEQQIASVFSNAHAACQTTTSHVAIHLMANLITGIRLQGKNVMKFTKGDILEMLCRPSVLGGLPVLHLSHFMVRGESDHLTIALSFAIHLLSTGLNQKLGWSLISTPLCTQRSKVNFVQLLTDPYCVPVNKPESSTAFLKRIMEQHVRFITKNKAITQVLRAFSKSQERRFIKCLSSMSAHLSKVMSVLWECSPFNILSEVIQKFENSRSIFQLLCINRSRTSLYRVLEGAKRRERNYLLWLHKMASRTMDQTKEFLGQTYADFMAQIDPVHLGIPICPTRYAQSVRDKAWGMPVLTVTYPCISDFVTIYPADEECPYSVQLDHILSQVFAPPPEDTNHHFAAGNRHPWIGTKTSEKLLLPQAKLEFEGSISSKITKILKLIEFIRGNGEVVMETLKWVLEKVSGQTLEHFLPFIPGRTSGTVTHRLRSRAFNETVMINELPNRTQLMSIHHDSHTSLQEKPGDFSVNYMTVLIHHLCMILFPLELCQKIDFSKFYTKFYSQLTIDCPDCFFDVSDNVTVESDCSLPDIPPLPTENPLIGYTTILQEELARQAATVGLPMRHRVFQAEQVAQDIEDETAHFIVGAALIRENFSVSQDAYELGIQIQYETQQMKMDALHNRPTRTSLSLTDWKATSGMAIAAALIAETQNWILRTPLLKTSALTDVIELPPQLNPFKIIAYKLTAAKKVQQVQQGFHQMHYPTRELGAFDLTNPESCARWLLATTYPIARDSLRSRRLETRLMCVYTYESDETLIARVRRLLDFACQCFYQNISRILMCHYIGGLDFQLALLPENQSLNPIYRQINEWRRQPDGQQRIDMYLNQILKQQLDCIFVNGVPEEIETIDFGTSFYACYGEIDEEKIGDFINQHIDDFCKWPIPMKITQDLSQFPPTPDPFLQDLAETLNWAVLRVERYGLYAAIARVREMISEGEDDPPEYGPRLPPGERALIHIGGHRTVLRDARDLAMTINHTGCEPLVNELLNVIQVEIPNLHDLIPLSQISRINGHTITSLVKLNEILRRCDILPNILRNGPEFWGLCLADGEGGFSNFLLGLSTRLNIIFNTLYIPSPDVPIHQTTPGEVLLAREPERSARCHSQHNYSGSNDLSQVLTITELSRIVQEKTAGLGVSIITFDAEGKDIEDNDLYYTLIRNVCCIALRTLSRHGVIILKTFLHRNPKIWAVLGLISDLFSYTRCMKPDTSHSGSGEFYIIMARPNLNLEARQVISTQLLQDNIFGPAFPDFLDEMRIVIREIEIRRGHLIHFVESPIRYFNWAICNWADPHLPNFSWGILFRRLSLMAPLGLVDPLTNEIRWNEQTLTTVMQTAETAREETRMMIDLGASSSLPYTTHTHLCHRLASYLRLTGFIYAIRNSPNNPQEWNQVMFQEILNACCQDEWERSTGLVFDGDLEGWVINPSRDNLKVNIRLEISSGIALAMRLKTAAACVEFYREVQVVPPYPYMGPQRDDT